MNDKRQKTGRGSVKQLPSGAWRYRITVRGKRHGATVKTEELAHDALAALRAVLASGRSPKALLADKSPKRSTAEKRASILYQKPRTTAAQKRRQQLKKYGLTPESYKAMLAAQNGGCAICLEVSISLRRLHVDHCHETGKVRGLLCGKCNPMLGLAEDSLEILKRAIAYLEAHKQP